MYAQNDEDGIIMEYVSKNLPAEIPKTILDIGANDGKTLSNSLLAIEGGFEAVLVEPCYAVFEKLKHLHKGNPKVHAFQYAICDKSGWADFYASGKMLGEQDLSLVSSLKDEETKKWREAGVDYSKTKVRTRSWSDFLNEDSPLKQFTVVSIDAEGYDYDILIQIDLTAIGCRMLIVEYNGEEREKYVAYASNHGMKLMSFNAENLIFIK